MHVRTTSDALRYSAHGFNITWKTLTHEITYSMMSKRGWKAEVVMVDLFDGYREIAGCESEGQMLE